MDLFTGDTHTSSNPPLCVDLDGTLVKTDLLLETVVSAVRNHWAILFCLLLWLFKGRAYLKQQLALRAKVRVDLLPYHQDFIKFLRSEKEKGRRLILTTASDERIAEDVARHLDIFNEVLASDGRCNLKGQIKARALLERFGDGAFDYAGNDASDVEVWRHARQAIVVNAPSRLSDQVAEITTLGPQFPRTHYLLKSLLMALRPHQWLKNVLIFVPALAAHQLTHLAVLLPASVTFAVFCGAASGVYLMNDALDLEDDRSHPRKKRRPFASGDLPLSYVLVGPVLILSALAAGFGVNLWTGWFLALYVVLSTGYSMYFKTQPLVDVFVLAGLYILRILIGGVATEITPSVWLLNASGFLFLGLAFLKRVTEYASISQARKSAPVRRGYGVQDTQLMMVLGVTSSFISALVVGLYVNSGQAKAFYAHPEMLWAAVPLILFWQCRMWLSASRGYMHEDPLVYAAKDWVSRLILLGFVIIFTLATLNT